MENRTKKYRNKITAREKTAIINYHLRSKNNSLDDISLAFGYPRSTISDIINTHFKGQRQIYIVPSLCDENTFFVFNEINERTFTVDYAGFIREGHLFSQEEKNIIKSYGFHF